MGVGSYEDEIWTENVAEMDRQTIACKKVP